MLLDFCKLYLLLQSFDLTKELALFLAFEMWSIFELNGKGFVLRSQFLHA